MSLFQLPSLTFQPRRYRYRGVGDWSGHVAFARDLIAALQPGLVVELGTHYGESYFTFCQSIREQGCNTKSFAIDTWQGDLHTGVYAEEVFDDVDGYNRDYYASFSTLMRKSFDDARSAFDERAIDLLHIDGLHGYESVRHDFETWLPKMSPGGIVLLHDIAVRRDGFGVWKLWGELREAYPTFEFVHSSGLGVIQVPGDRESHGILRTMFASEANCADGIRHYYEMCAERLDCRDAQAREFQWDIVSQLFWRSEDEEFVQARSVRASLTLTTHPSVVRLEAPAVSGLRELRFDPTNRRMALRVLCASLLDADGAVVWELGGDEFFRFTRHSGAVQTPGGPDGSLVVAAGDDCSILIPLAEYDAKLGSAWVLRIEMCGVAPEVAIQDLARGLPQNVEVDLALDEAQQLAVARSQEAELVRESLALAERLARERSQELERYDAALGEAQRIVIERTGEAEALTKALATAEELVQRRTQEVQRYDTALGEAQRIVTERTGQIGVLTSALATAEELVQRRTQELHQYDAALGDAQRLAAQQSREVEELARALAQAQRVAAEHAREVEQLTAALKEKSIEFERIQADLRNSGLALEQRKAELEKIERSLSWRLSRPLRTLEHLARSISSNS